MIRRLLVFVIVGVFVGVFVGAVRVNQMQRTPPLTVTNSTEPSRAILSRPCVKA